MNSNNLPIYYIAPGKNIEKVFTEETMQNYLSHMDRTIGVDCVWIFDGTGLENMDMPNPMLIQRFYKLIDERYGAYLKNIFIINMNWKVDAIYKIIKTFMSEDIKRRVTFCKHPIELVAAGIKATLVDIIYRR